MKIYDEKIFPLISDEEESCWLQLNLTKPTIFDKQNAYDLKTIIGIPLSLVQYQTFTEQKFKIMSTLSNFPLLNH